MEFSLVDLTCFCKVVLSLTLKLAINKVSFVIISIELKASLTSFLGINKHSLIFDRIVIPCLTTLSMVLVIQPLPSIHGSLSVDVNTKTIGLSLLPFSLINISVWVSHSSLTMEETVHCLALIFASICIDDCTQSFIYRFVSILSPLSLILFVLINFYEEIVPD